MLPTLIHAAFWTPGRFLPGAALAALLMASAGCSKKSGAEALPKPMASELPVATATASSAPTDAGALGGLVATGTTLAIKQAELSAKVSGALTSVKVAEGDRVKKGQLLFVVDTSTAAMQVKQAKAQLSAAKVSLSGADLEYKRTRELARMGAVSSAALDQSKLAYDQAKVGVEQAEAAVSSARKAAADGAVRSPLTGVVAKKLKETGESVSANAAPVVVVQDISTLEVRVNLPESALATVRPGSAMSVEIRALGKTFATKVDRINPSADRATRTIEVVGLIANPEGLLKSGLLAEVRFSEVSPPPRGDQ
jgi:RND family efflux transporter MFP subunit